MCTIQNQYTCTRIHTSLAEQPIPSNSVLFKPSVDPLNNMYVL